MGHATLEVTAIYANALGAEEQGIAARMWSPSYVRDPGSDRVPLAMADAISAGGVGTGEQVAQGPPPTQGHANPPSMLWSVVQHVAPLAERPDVAMPPTAMSWIMIEMCGRQHHLGCPDWCILGQGRRGDLAASPVAPSLFRLIPPATITQMLHGLAMRPAADLAVALGPDEPDPVADLRPVDRIEVAQLRLDRHGRVPAQASRAAVRARGRWR